jgi:spermidine/putrescine transport system substrate-binding protein
LKKNFRTRILVLLLAAASAFPTAACGSGTPQNGAASASDDGAAADGDNVLYVYNWGEYIGDGVVEQFEKETGIRVVYDTFQTNEEMYPIIEAGAIRYDVVCPSDYIIQKMIRNDMLYPIDWDKVPNISNIDEKYMKKSEAFDPGNRYSVPYCWGTIGILYNTSLVSPQDTPDSWNALWDEKYSDNILMLDSVRDTFMVAEKLLGYDVNTTDEKQLEACRDLLIRQKPLVQAYVVDQVRDKMIGGEAAMAMIYSGELLYVQECLEEAGSPYVLKYVIPKEGSNVWIDSWVIPKNARHKENAEKWLNFLCRAEIAKENFEYITYPTPNRAAFELLDPDIRNNREVFPDDADLEKCSVFEYLGTAGDELYDTMWNEVKAY